MGLVEINLVIRHQFLKVEPMHCTNCLWQVQSSTFPHFSTAILTFCKGTMDFFFLFTVRLLSGLSEKGMIWNRKGRRLVRFPAKANDHCSSSVLSQTFPEVEECRGERRDRHALSLREAWGQQLPVAFSIRYFVFEDWSLLTQCASWTKREAAQPPRPVHSGESFKVWGKQGFERMEGTRTRPVTQRRQHNSHLILPSPWLNILM